MFDFEAFGMNIDATLFALAFVISAILMAVSYNRKLPQVVRKYLSLASWCNLLLGVIITALVFTVPITDSAPQGEIEQEADAVKPVVPSENNTEKVSIEIKDEGRELQSKGSSDLDDFRKSMLD